MNPHDKFDEARLRNAIKRAREQYRPFRENRKLSVEEFAGPHFGSGANQGPAPLALLYQAVTVHMHNLVGAPPRAFVRPRHKLLNAGSKDLQIVINHVVEEIKLYDTLIRVVQDALFSVGLVKIGMVGKSPNDKRGFWNNLWQPFVDRIDPDNWVQDMSTSEWDECAFFGHRYQLPLSVVQQSEVYDREVRKALQPLTEGTINEEGDERISEVGMEIPAFSNDQLYDMVELWDVYLPREGLLITMPVDECGQGVLRAVPYRGPECGPYLRLAFISVPGNPMPLPPVAAWYDLHRLGNQIYNKLGIQANRQRTLLQVLGGGEADIATLQRAVDGDVVAVSGQPAQEVRYGGPDQINLAFMMTLLRQFKSQAGNIDTLGGLATAADTLGQEQMLAQQASQSIVYMRRLTNEFVGDILRSLAFYLYSDPFVNVKFQKAVPGTKYSAPSVWSSETREGDFLDFNVRIEPYSMTYKSPEMQFHRMLQVVERIVLPGMALVQGQGGILKMETLLRLAAEYLDNPEIQSILEFTGPPQVHDTGVIGQSGGKPPSTSRTYNRINQSTANPQGQEAALAQAFMGGAPPGASQMQGLMDKMLGG